MPDVNISKTNLANAIPTIVAAKALGYLKANIVLAGIVARDWDDQVAQFGEAVKIPYTGTFTANDKAEDAAVTLQVQTPSVYTVTLDKHKEVSFIIEDIGRIMSRPDMLGQLVSDAMAVMVEKVESDIAALYAGLSQTIDATTGLFEDDFREAQRLLNAAKAPVTQRWAVLHEDGYKEAMAIEKLTNRDYQGDAALAAIKQGYLGQYAGWNIVMSQLVAVAGGQCKNLFIHRNALALVTRSLPAADPGAGVIQRTMSEDGVGLRVTLSYNPDHLGYQVTIDTLYGVAELRDSHGIAVSTDEV